MLRRFLDALPWPLLAALLAGLFIACVADDAPLAAGPEFTSPSENGSGVCSSPNEGCPCATDETAPCGITVGGSDSFLYCEKGFRTCNAGVWGACVTDGVLTPQSAPTTLAPDDGGVGLRARGSEMRCGAYDAGAGRDAGINLCDPYCMLQSDTPPGIDAGSNFAIRDGGFVSIGCGDGIKATSEECDDGNNVSGDGCSGNCNLEKGFKCPTPGAACSTTTCGDGIVEGAEECDDGNLRPYDGCNASCDKEPVCPTGSGCTAVCGDGIKFASEACDDGNIANGDGCSSTCQVEANATCTTTTPTPPTTLNVPVVYRDFVPTGVNQHRDFENFNCGLKTGIPNTTLAADGRPTLRATNSCVTSAASFFQWYHDDATVNRTFIGDLPLTRQADGSYRYTSSSFFPLNGLGFGNYGTTGKNFHFTSELRYPFTYKGGEYLTFTGDDDVFVYINGRLAVDLGGVHGPQSGAVTLSGASATNLGLTVGSTYEVVVFQAERHTSGSNYVLSIGGFDRTISSCVVPSSRTIIRDYQATCTPGFRPIWQLFRWKASVPPSTTIEFRAATATTLAALPIAPVAAPGTVSVGTATNANSPNTAAPNWRTLVDGTNKPTPVQAQLVSEGATVSKDYLRVFMTFNGLSASRPRLDEWQQLYSCVPYE